MNQVDQTKPNPKTAKTAKKLTAKDVECPRRHSGLAHRPGPARQCTECGKRLTAREITFCRKQGEADEQDRFDPGSAD